MESYSERVEGGGGNGGEDEISAGVSILMLEGEVDLIRGR